MKKHFRLLVLQHARVEHPGIYREMFRHDGIQWDTIELDEQEPLPGLDDYQGLWVMGGPMDVWQSERHPWLTQEIAFIREAVQDRQLPFLGFCLGHQLLACALGGEVKAAATPEIGMMDLHVHDLGDALFGGGGQTRQVLQWHSAEVSRIPESVQILASSPACSIQAMRFGGRAFSMQFHMEITMEMLEQWGRIPEYRDALHQALGGADSLERLCTQVHMHLPEMRRDAEYLYQSWMSCARSGASSA